METSKRTDGDNSKRYVAWLDAGSAMPPIRCYVENVTRSGAKLNMLRSPIPDEFNLYFNGRGDAKVRCRVTSRGKPQCDVEFIASLESYN